MHEFIKSNIDLSINSHELASHIRKSVVHMTSSGNSSHVGSCLSIADILAVLYSKIINVYPSKPNHADRDVFILSKGHAGAAVYSTLAYIGFFDQDLLKSHYQNGSILSGHVSHKEVPGVELSTGSLGHGLGVATGMAYADKIDNKKNRFFVIMSDGECDEGSNWEAILFASHHHLSNLFVVVDYNKLQSMKSPEETLSLEPFVDKWKAFGWHVIEVDGHDHEELIHAFNNNDINKPLCVIAHTTKGKGVSFMENEVLWHYRSPQGDEYNKAIKELNDA
jgi:transketolase